MTDDLLTADEFFQHFDCVYKGPVLGWECRVKPNTDSRIVIEAVTDIADYALFLITQDDVVEPDAWYEKAYQVLLEVERNTEIKHALREAHIQDADSAGEPAGILCLGHHAASWHEFVRKILSCFCRNRTLSMLPPWSNPRETLQSQSERIGLRLKIESTRARRILESVETGTVAPPKDDGWHRAGDAPPDAYSHGPLTGSKKDLKKWIFGDAARTTKGLDTAIKAGKFWGRQDSRYLFSIYFPTQERFAQANTLKLRNPPEMTGEITGDDRRLPSRVKYPQ